MRGWYVVLSATLGVLACSSDSSTDVGSASSSGFPRGGFGDDSNYPGTRTSTSSTSSSTSSSGCYDCDSDRFPPVTDASAPYDAGPPNLGSLNVGAITAIKVQSDVCFRPAGTCGDAQVFELDLASGKLTTTTCVELSGGGTQDVKSTHVVKAGDLANVKTLLANVKVTTNYPALDGGNPPGGPLHGLNVIEGTSESAYASTDGFCGPGNNFVVAGWQPLFDALRSM